MAAENTEYIDFGKDDLTSDLKCDLCGKIFSQKRYLKRHRDGCLRKAQRVKSKELASKCGICGKDFPSVSRVQRHQLLVHLNARDHHCPHCAHSFTQAAHLKRHIKAKHDEHNAGERFPCLDCPSSSDGNPKSFPTRWELERHRNSIHSMSEQCRICSSDGQIFLFTSESAWKAHQEYHSGKKPYLCQHCYRGFRTAAQLENHANAVHRTGKKFECVPCGAQFVQRTQVDRHLNSKHHTSKPWKCNCGVTFAGRDGLRGHLEVKHGQQGRFFLCAYCPVWFTDKASLLRHYDEAHFKRLSSMSAVEAEGTEHSDDDVPFPDEPFHTGVSSSNQSLSLRLKLSAEFEPTKTLELGGQLPENILDEIPSLQNLTVSSEEAFRPRSTLIVKVALPPHAVLSDSLATFLSSPLEIEL